MHHGNSANSGHYTCIIKSFINHKWYNINDETVQLSNDQQAVHSMAYLLFYKKRQDGLLFTNSIITNSN